MSTNDESVPATKADVTALKTDVTMLKTDVTAIKVDITALQDAIEAIHRKIDEKHEETMRHFDVVAEKMFHDFAGITKDALGVSRDRCDDLDRRTTIIECHLGMAS